MKRLLLGIALFAAALIFVGCGDEATTSTSQSLGNPPQQPSLGGGETAPNTGTTVAPGTGSIPPPPGSSGELGELGSSGCAQGDLQCTCEHVVSHFETCYGPLSPEYWAFCTSKDLQDLVDRECRDQKFVTTVDCWNFYDQLVASCIGSPSCQCDDIFTDTPTIDNNFN